MSNCVLISYDIAPPGLYPYEQTEGITRKFPALPTIESQAQAVSAFRTGNHLPRASVAECMEDISIYNCQRLGCHKNYCRPVGVEGTSNLALASSNPIIAPCRGCGGVVSA